jgi:hypothetical protein
MAKILPDEKITVEQVGKGVAISGIVATKKAKKVALSIGASFFGKGKVVDNIRIDDVPTQVILKRYSSLSKIAREITGSRWSGPRFFGLTGRGKVGGNSAEAPHE